MSDKIKIAVADADRKQLAHAAKNDHNLEFDGRKASVSDLRALLKQIGVEEIEVDADGRSQDSDDNTGDAPAAKSASSSLENCKFVTVIIPSTEKDKDPVFLGVNGKGMFVERDKEQKISVKFYNVLKDAQKTIYEKGKAENDAAIMNPRKVSRYPHSIVSYH